MLFFFNDTATTEIYTLSLHDALPIFDRHRAVGVVLVAQQGRRDPLGVAAVAQLAVELVDEVAPVREDEHAAGARALDRSEEHTSELQSRQYLVCRLLLEKKTTTSHLQGHRLANSPLPVKHFRRWILPSPVASSSRLSAAGSSIHLEQSGHKTHTRSGEHM